MALGSPVHAVAHCTASATVGAARLTLDGSGVLLGRPASADLGLEPIRAAQATVIYTSLMEAGRSAFIRGVNGIGARCVDTAVGGKREGHKTTSPV